MMSTPARNAISKNFRRPKNSVTKVDHELIQTY